MISRTLVDAVASNNQVLTVLLDLQLGRERDTIYVLVGSLVETVEGDVDSADLGSGAFALQHPPIVSYSVFGYQLGTVSGANGDAGTSALVEKSFFILPDEPLYDVTRHP